MNFDECEKFTFFWKVENFRNSLLKKGEFISSPNILLKNFCNTRWNFDLFPKGNADSKENCSSIFLNRNEDNGPDEIELEIEFYLNSKFLAQEVKRFTKGFGHGFDEVSLELEKLNSFILKCIINMTHHHMDNSKVFKTIPQYHLFQSISLTPDILEKIHLKTEQELFKVQKRYAAFPSQCIAYSRFQVEMRKFCWPIVFEKDKNKQEIPIISFTSVPSLLLSLILTKKENSQMLKIDVKPIEDDFINEEVFIRIQLSIVDNKNGFTDKTEEEHLFKNNENWQLGHDFVVQDKIDNHLFQNKKLSCQLEFSNGEVFHEILGTSDVSVIKEESYCNSGSSSKIFSYDKLNKFYDVALCTTNKTFEAHKVILSTRSPVFEAMFESGMKESQTNEIQILDIDSDTLEKMLHFIYSGTLTDIDYHCANKLFSAADKYEILSLKDLCRTILNNNLNVVNVCDILSLADSHSDSKLKNAAMKFLRMNKCSILSSSEWKDFVSKNRELALDILTDVCMQLG